MVDPWSRRNLTLSGGGSTCFQMLKAWEPFFAVINASPTMKGGAISLVTAVAEAGATPPFHDAMQ